MSRHSPPNLEAMQRVNSPIIYGLENIAAFFGRSVDTIMRWRRLEGLPIARSPSGVWFTTRDLINEWILIRNSIDPYCGNGQIIRSPFDPATQRASKFQVLASQLSPEELKEVMEEFGNGETGENAA